MKCYLYSLLIIMATLSHGGDSKVTAELATRNAYVGDAVHLEVRFYHDLNDPVVQEPLPETLGDATVLDQKWTLPGPDEKGPEYTTLLVDLAWYRLGEFKVPPLKFKLTGGEELETPELNIEIIKLLDEKDQTLAPLKGQVKMSFTLLLIWAAAILAVLLLIIGLLFYWFFKRKKPEAKAIVPAQPPYDEAIAALNALNAGGLLKEGRVKEFYVAITQIIRHYYGRIYEIGAEEMTSFELEAWFEDNSHRLPGDLFYLNRAFQEQCDRVKFAKHDPVEAENKETTNRAYLIVESLRPISVTLKEENNHVALG